MPPSTYLEPNRMSPSPVGRPLNFITEIVVVVQWTYINLRFRLQVSDGIRRDGVPRAKTFRTADGRLQVLVRDPRP
jgi:hypothetical protein